MKELLSFGIGSVFLFPCIPCACEHDAGSENIGADECLGILNASVDMAFRSKVYNAVDVVLIEDLFDGILIGYISLYEGVILPAFNVLEVLKVSCVCEHIHVDDTDLVSVLFEHVVDVV